MIVANKRISTSSHVTQQNDMTASWGLAWASVG